MKHVPIETAYPPGWFQPGEDKVTLDRAPMHECWAEVEKLVADGLARNIGVSNFNVQLLMDLLTYAKIKPAALQSKLERDKESLKLLILTLTNLSSLS